MSYKSFSVFFQNPMDNYPPYFHDLAEFYQYPPPPEQSIPLYAPVPQPYEPPMDLTPFYEQPTDVVQSTFPTPSELLAELAATGLPPATADDFGSDGRSESARKARRRAMAKSVGFIPTDPDTISSHDKKRHYLECLEQYVMYLHQQLELVGSQPVPLERVSNYRGLSSRSIRTLLVHMENTTRRLNIRTLDEEQRFVALRDLVYKRTNTGDRIDNYL